MPHKDCSGRMSSVVMSSVYDTNVLVTVLIKLFKCKYII